MTVDSVSNHKKTDEEQEVSAGQDEVPANFSILDVLRILVGLLMLYSLCCKFLSGNWFYFGSARKVSSTPADLLKIPEYWSQLKPGQDSIAFSLEELSQYSGDSNADRILLSVKGHVFDVTRGSRFYGKWGAYKKFTGTDCSKSFSYPQWDMSALTKKCSSDLSDSSSTELARVDSWLKFFQKKYPEIGYVRELVEM